MRAVDYAMREAWDYAHPLKESDVPKYIAKMIEREVSERHAWALAHRPVEVTIDLSRLHKIRNAAAEVREALLIDEERDEGIGANEAATDSTSSVESLSAEAMLDKSTAAADKADEPVCNDSPAADISQQPHLPETAQDIATCSTKAVSPLASAAATTPFGAVAKGLTPTVTGPASGNDTSRPLDANQTQYLTALLASDTAARAHALSAVSTSEDMMVDAINGALFDLLGDTAIEYGPDGPQIIEDYREDVEEILA